MTSRRIVRSSLIAAVIAAFAVAPSSLQAGGTILTSGAAIGVGAGTPAGALTIDASAPAAAPPNIAAVPAIGAIGPIDGMLAPFGGAGAGGIGRGELHHECVGSRVGTYEFTSYTIAANVGVTYTGR